MIGEGKKEEEAGEAGENRKVGGEEEEKGECKRGHVRLHSSTNDGDPGSSPPSLLQNDD